VNDWTRAGDVDHELPVPIKIGACWIAKTKLKRPYPEGRVWVTDVFPFEGDPRRVQFADYHDRREWLPLDEFRRRFQFRSR
jgi:hypothetical protein